MMLAVGVFNILYEQLLSLHVLYMYITVLHCFEFFILYL